MDETQLDTGTDVKEVDLSRTSFPKKVFKTKQAFVSLLIYLVVATALIWCGKYSYVALIAGFALYVRLIAFVLRALNYIDDIYLKSEPTFNEGLMLFFVLWANSILGVYPQELENTNCDIKTSVEYGNLTYRFCWHSWHPYVLGFIELWAYPVFMKYQRMDYIYLYIGLKTVSQFELWKNKRRAFNVFLIGNIIVICFALHLLRVTENLPIPQSLVRLGHILQSK